MHDMRYFGPSLQEVQLAHIIPPLVHHPIYSKHDHAIQSLAIGPGAAGIGHMIAFQLRGGCRVGLYNIPSHTAQIVHTPSKTFHGLTRSRIAFSKTDPILFYGDNSFSISGVDCGGLLESSQTPPLVHYVDVGNSVVTCMDTHPTGIVVAGLGSHDVIICNNSIVHDGVPVVN